MVYLPFYYYDLYAAHGKLKPIYKCDINISWFNKIFCQIQNHKSSNEAGPEYLPKKASQFGQKCECTLNASTKQGIKQQPHINLQKVKKNPWIRKLCCLRLCGAGRGYVVLFFHSTLCFERPFVSFWTKGIFKLFDTFLGEGTDGTRLAFTP